jgi:hypothetical protein
MGLTIKELNVNYTHDKMKQIAVTICKIMPVF